jgi:hypothetical protein
MAVTPTWSTSKGTIRGSEREALIRDQAEAITADLLNTTHPISSEWYTAADTLELAALAGHITFTRAA